MYCLMNLQKYLPCSIKLCFGQLVSQEVIQYIQQVLLKLTLLAIVLTNNN